MERKVSLSELASRFSEMNHLSSEMGDNFVDRFFEVLENALLRENIVKIKGFGTFRIVQVADRESVDVNTGDRILIQGHSKLSFTPDTEMRDKVNKPFVAFEPIVLNEGTDEEEMAYIPEESKETDVDEEEGEQQLSSPQIPVQEENDAYHENVSEPQESPQNEEAPEEPNESMQSEPVECLKDNPLVQEAMPEEPQESVISMLEEPQAVITSPEEPQAVKYDDNKFQWGYLLYALLTIVLMGGSYYAGYYRLLCPCQVTQNSERVSEKKDTSKQEEIITQDTVVQPKIEEPPVEAQYPQVPGGAYLIVGVKGVHQMAIGDNLYKIARKEYGDNDFARYIIVLNQFKDPDKIPLGYHVKLPMLRPNK